MQELEMENSKLKEEMHKILMNLASKEDFNEDAQPTPAAKQFIGMFPDFSANSIKKITKRSITQGYG